MLDVIVGDIWEFHSKGYVIAITTNEVVKTNGENVQGKGLALEAARRFPEFPALVGTYIRTYGNHVEFFPDFNLLSFPTKYNWRDPSDLKLIARSCQEVLSWLRQYVFTKPSVKVGLPKVGCNNGGLNWELQVEPIVESILGNVDRIIIVDKK